MGMMSDIAKGVVISVFVTILSTALVILILFLAFKYGLIPYLESRLPEGMIDIIKKIFG